MTLTTSLTSHTEVTTAGIEQHSFELTVGPEAEDIGHDVVDGEQDEHSQGQVLRKTGILHCVCELSMLDCKAELVKDDEKVDRYIEDVDDEAAEVHLGESAKQNGDVDQLVNSLHRHDEAEHDCKGHVDETKDHEH